ncbi:alpha/beta fold hydrolase [Erythrobacteraceae bacterium CFH 75059]|uniref:esterase/lipase family protein n=1 Tax=Qipengyuania thermophila TaxID=2509361 RepID=UPI00101FACC4|nr:alpha/beta fold hydrolase [Qipengyuania thermophila]TCD06367.1 alpha/beta fold hydrolase [Erythrobacteraceae bacterium CFH 75059]
MTTFASSPVVRSRHRAEIARRIALAREPLTEKVHGPPRRLLLGEMGWVLEPVRRRFRTLPITSARHPRAVMLLPGFVTHPARMRYLQQALEAAGHRVSHWGLGMNWGATPERLASVERRVTQLRACHGEPLVLIGWSLGGLFAREVAKRRPDAVAKVITMGTPFSGNMRANNAWRAYQAIAGYRVDQPPVETQLAQKPPVETVALWSARDGIVSPRCACGRPGERDRAIRLRCTHMGFIFMPEAIGTLLSELDSPPPV